MTENTVNQGARAVTMQLPFDLYEWIKAKGEAQMRKVGPQISHVLREVKAAEDKK